MLFLLEVDSEAHPGLRLLEARRHLLLGLPRGGGFRDQRLAARSSLLLTGKPCDLKKPSSVRDICARQII